MVFAIVLLLPLQLQSAQPDRLADLVAEMGRLTLAGDHRAVGRVLPVILDELASPHAEVADAWNQVGVYFYNQGDPAAAERAYKEGLRMLGKEANRPGGLESLLLLNLAGLYLESGQRPAYAEVLCRRALKLATEHPDRLSPEPPNYMYILALARLQQGDRKQARQYFQQALDLTFGGPDGRLCRSAILANVGVLAAMDDQWFQARDAFLQSIDLLEVVLGRSHPDLVRAHLNLARIYVHLKEWTSAQASLARARQITEARLGPDHPVMAEILATSANVLRSTGHRREARDLSRRANAIAAARPNDAAAKSWVHVSDLKVPSRD